MLNNPDTIKIDWYTNPNTGEQVVFERTGQSYKVIRNQIFLDEIPDFQKKVLISGLYEIHDGELAENNFKVNYSNSKVTFHSSKEGQMITVTKYYAKGLIKYPATRITKVNDKGYFSSDNVDEIIDEVYEKAGSVDKRIDNIIAQSGTSGTEVVDARTDSGGVVYSVLRERLNATDTKVGQKVSSPNIKNARDNLGIFEYTLDDVTWKQVQGSSDGGGTPIDIDDVNVSTTSTWSSHKIDTEIKSVATQLNEVSDTVDRIINNGDTTPPSSIVDFTAKAGNSQVTLSWTNPANEDFAGVKILRKIGSYPTSKSDGTLVYNGANISYVDNTVVNDTTYYYRIFPYDTVGNYNTVEAGQQAVATPKPFVIYGVKIDTTNSNPASALTYTDGAIGFTPALGNNGNFNAGSWADKFPFNAIKPCLYTNGLVNYYLNPSNYAQKVDGSASDISSGADGDVMVEFPKIWWKFETLGTDLYVRYADAQVDSTYKCLAHMRGTTEKDKCYISAYMGHSLSSKLRSLSGKTPTANQTIGAFRTLAQTNGANYDQMAYYPLLMLQVLFIVMFKNRDSQTALGRGYVDGNSASISTGGSNSKGLFYGETTGKLQNKFCGIEDFYGNVRYWIDGFFSDASRNMLIANQVFNNTGSGYANYGQGATANIGGYMSAVQGGTETGFVAKAVVGSVTTHYADYGYLYASSLPYFGGSWANADVAGAFYLSAYGSASVAYASLGARLLAL